MPPTKVSKSAILACLDGKPAVTRFAPSPTGYLHLGHLVNAIYVWGIAQGIGGKVILRMEDHDQTRVRPAYDQAILDDLEWLGLDFHVLYRQSDANEVYTSIANELIQRNLLYACECSRKTVRQRVAPLPNRDVPYDNYCRDRGLGMDKGHPWRICIHDKSAIRFLDLLQGPQTQNPHEHRGDMIIRDRNGNWTYQFAVVVDDLRHGVNLIIRGLDILDSTGRQQQIAKVLGGERDLDSCCYLHHGLLMGPNGVKLSKKHFDKDIHERMLAGEAAEDVLGEAAFWAGLIPEKRSVEIGELPGLVLD